MERTRNEAAERLRVTVRTVDRLIRRGHLVASKTAEGGQGRVLITDESIESFLAARRIPPSEKVAR